MRDEPSRKAVGDQTQRLATHVPEVVKFATEPIQAVQHDRARHDRRGPFTLVTAAATRDLFIGEAPDLLGRSALDGITVTNTVCALRVPPGIGGRVAVLDASDPIARPIMSCHAAF